MHTPLQIRDLITEVSPLLGLMQAHESSDNPKLWWLAWHNGVVVEIEYDDEDEEQRLYMSADLGDVPEEPSVSFLSTLLQYNGIWQETGGLRMALRDGKVVLIHDVFAPAQTVPVFCTILGNFAEVALHWEQMLEQRTEHHQSGPSQPVEEEEELTALLRSGLRI